MSARDKLDDIEARLLAATRAEAGLQPTPVFEDDVVRRRVADIARSLGDAWQLQFKFNPYAETKEWDEAAHPRGEGGKFVSGGGSSAVSVTATPTWKSSRTKLDTSRLDGAHTNAVDPPGLSSATAEQRMLDLYDRSVAQGHAATDVNWYVNAHNQVGQWANDLGVDKQRFADAVAATSPLTLWKSNNGKRQPNLEAARAMVKVDRAHPDLDAKQIRAITPNTGEHPFLGNSVEKAARALRGENPDDVFATPKIRSFNNNITHPESPFDVTVDTHMGRMMLDRHDDTDEAKKSVEKLIQGRKIGRGPKAQTVGGYGWAADRIRSAAQTRQVDPPSAFQAVVWEQWRREGGAVTTRLAPKKKMEANSMDTEENLTDEEAWELWQEIIDWADAGAPKDWKPEDGNGQGTKTLVATEEDKANPYHDERGRFASGDAATFVSLWGKPDAGEAPVVGQSRGIREDYSPQRMTARREAMIGEATRVNEELDHRTLEAQMVYDQKTEANRKLALVSQALNRDEVRLRDEISRIQHDIDDRVPPEAIPDARRFLAGKLQEQRETVDAHNAAFARLMADQPNLEKAQREYGDKIDAIKSARKGLNQALREKYINAPEGPGKLTISGFEQSRRPDGSLVLLKVTPGLEPPLWHQGLQEVNRMVGNVLTEGNSQVQMRKMDEGDPWYASGRSYHNNFGITLHPTDARVSTVVHEMGHQIEDSVPGMTERIWEHIDSRTQGEANRKLSEITGGNYNASEVAKPDQFFEPYMGKDYNKQASEFLSMSMQAMYEDPVGFAKKDPKSFDFTSRVLAEARATGEVQPTQALADQWLAEDVARGAAQ